MNQNVPSVVMKSLTKYKCLLSAITFASNIKPLFAIGYETKHIGIQTSNKIKFWAADAHALFCILISKVKDILTF